MSTTSDFVGLIEPWEYQDTDADSIRWMQDHADTLRAKYEQATETMEKLLFSAWVQTLRDEWDGWCKGYYNE